MPGPPLGSVLLLRRALPSLRSPDLFRVTEERYDPATRTVDTYVIADSSDGRNYNRPKTDLVDSWCDNKGVAPFRQHQVYHDGLGGVTFTFVDGAAACQLPPCALTVTLTASAVVDGRGILTATVTNAVGAYLLSLDGFQTPGYAPAPGTNFVEFTRLRPGRYTVTARETRTGGCTATASHTLSVAYGPRYRVPFKDRDEADCLLQVFEREYTGEVETLTAQPRPVVLDYPGGATDHLFSQLLKGSQCQLALYLMREEQLLPLYSGDERLHRVDYTRGGLLVWRGYLLPEQYSVAFLAPPTTFDLSATDGLGTLSDLPFTGSAGELLRGDWTLLEIVLHCLGKLELGLPLHVLLSLLPAGGSAGTPAIEQIRFDAATFADDKGKPYDCGKVLTGLLAAFQARLYQQDGAWWFERLAELSIEEMAYAAYAPDGARLADIVRSRLVNVQIPDDGQPHWQEATQRQDLRPAVARVTVQADPGEAVNLLAFALPRPVDVPAGVPALFAPFGWSTGGGLPGTPYSSLVYQGATKAPLLRLVGTTGNATTPERAAWVQTPPTLPVPFGSSDGGYADEPLGGYVALSFTAKPYNVTPAPGPLDQSRLFIAVQIGGVWVRNNGQESSSPLYEEFRFPDAQAQVFILNFGRMAQRITQRQSVVIRLVGPLGGATPCTVDISDLRLRWQNDVVGRVDSIELDDRNTGTYTAETGQLVSLTDESLTLFHSDTVAVRRAGTPLDFLGRPVRGWQEAATPGQLRELGDYAVRDRVLWQAGPAQVLSGTLRGPFPGPGALLTDPNEVRPAVYLLTGVQHDAAAATWTHTAVQNRQLIAPPLTLPENAIYNEDNADDPTAWLSEAGHIMVYE